MNWKEHKKRLMKDPEFRQEYEALEPEFRPTKALDADLEVVLRPKAREVRGP